MGNHLCSMGKNMIALPQSSPFSISFEFNQMFFSLFFDNSLKI
jgi:hypothetical protein